jgi:hypothetical protein
MARRNSGHFEPFPYNHEYYALLRIKENERFCHYEFQARSPQVSIAWSSLVKFSLHYKKCFGFYFSVTPSTRVDKIIERAQRQTKSVGFNISPSNSFAGHIHGLPWNWTSAVDVDWVNVSVACRWIRWIFYQF